MLISNVKVERGFGLPCVVCLAMETEGMPKSYKSAFTKEITV